MSDLLLTTPLTDCRMQNLDADIVWSIFNMNADILDECPLKTARLTSQVCGSWRNLMLASSGIWGRTLKLSELRIEEDNNPWRDLVMERTGSASLFFRGKLSPSRVEWFLGFISGYWGRIRHLDTSSAGSDLILSTNTDFMDEPSQCVVFQLPCVVFNLQTPWVHNLRSINLSNPLPITRIMECLDHMPHLEQATLSTWSPDIGDHTVTLSKPKKISLPHLTFLRITHFYPFVADIFQCITANPYCSYTILTGGGLAGTTAQREIFSGYFQRQIDSLTYPRVQLMVTNELISVKLAGDSTGSPVYHHVHFPDVLVVQESDVLTYMSLFYFGKSTSGITELDWDIKTTDEEDHLPYTLPSFKDFFSAFPSVTTLPFSLQSPSVFTRIPGIDETIFPLLEEVIIWEYSESLTLPLQSQIAKFLDHRRSYGKPIRTLRLGLIIKADRLNLRWGFIEEFDAMEVAFYLKLRDGKHVKGTYLCGSGTPNELDMIEVGKIDLSTVGIHEMEKSACL